MKKEDNIKEKINEIFTRGIGEFIDPEGVFRKKLETDPKSIVIKLGADPNRPDIHLGHAVVLRKLRAFQDLGCKVIFLVGDYTAQIGDPTGKNKVRPDTEQAEIEKNAQTYISQIEKILRTDQEVFSWIRNSDWFYSPSDLIPDPKIKSAHQAQLPFQPTLLRGRRFFLKIHACRKHTFIFLKSPQ